MTEDRFKSGFIPASHKILWLVLRVLMLVWGVYGLFHGSVVEFLEALFAIAFTHLWDFFQIAGNFSFITKLDFTTQTMLNVFIFIGVVIGSTLNNRTNFHHFDLVTHFFAGFISSWVAHDLAVIVQGKKRRLSPALTGMFCIFAACFIAVGWEIYEFTMDRVYGLLLQNSLPMSDAGLTDTMVDIIMSSIGAVIGMLLVVFYNNGILGSHKELYKQRAKELEEKEELKEQLLKDYLENNTKKQSGG